MYLIWAFQVVLMVKNLLTNTSDLRDPGSIPGLGRFPGGGPSQPAPVLLPGESSWTEELGRLLSTES